MNYLVRSKAKSGSGRYRICFYNKAGRCNEEICINRYDYDSEMVEIEVCSDFKQRLKDAIFDASSFTIFSYEDEPVLHAKKISHFMTEDMDKISVFKVHCETRLKFLIKFLY